MSACTVKGLSKENLVRIYELCSDLIKVGYQPILVNDSVSYSVQTISNIMSTMKIVEAKFSIIFKRAVGDNTRLNFVVENETLCIVSFDCNCMNFVPFFKYYRALS